MIISHVSRKNKSVNVKSDGIYHGNIREVSITHGPAVGDRHQDHSAANVLRFLQSLVKTV
jgi:hypothetical protein